MSIDERDEDLDDDRVDETEEALVRARPTKRTSPKTLAMFGAALVLAVLAFVGWKKLTAFPADDTPEGSYLRIAFNLGRGNVKECFAYLEERSQHAAFTIRDYRKQSSDRVRAAYPEPDRTRLLESYRAAASAEDGPDEWVLFANAHNYPSRLRRDLSGVASVERQGERATIVTARGTRYSFRRRDNGIWGLTMFTGELEAEAERAARDYEVVDQAAKDYERSK